MSDDLTLVLLSWKKRRRNYRLLFGTPQRQIRLDWRRHLAVFQPGDVFAYERWDANKYGTQNWTIHILQAGVGGAPICELRGVKPGAIILYRALGKPACKALLQTCDLVRKTMPLERIKPRDWHLIGHHLGARLEPRKAVELMRNRP